MGTPKRLGGMGGEPTIRLRSVEHLYEPDYWIEGNAARRTIAAARIELEIDGARHALWARPYQAPVTLGNVRFSVESTREWATTQQLIPCECPGDVRLAYAPADQSWGPPGLRFPIRDYRWRSSPYGNTWGSLVPSNKFYYHRGEDFGAFPDLLEVVAPADGTITASPHTTPHGSNSLSIDIGGGVTIRFGHMNIEHIPARLVEGATVRRGEIIGRTGCTWDGRKSQHFDPHLHVGMSIPGIGAINAYALLAEAYLRDFPDDALAIAGAYAFALPGQNILLDGTRSLARPGRSITSHTWHLSNGEVRPGAITSISYEHPGCYTEELRIRTDGGFEARDFVQVRVYNAEHGRDIAFGWAYIHPQRGIKAGSEITVWNRLKKTCTPVSIDWGDGAPRTAIDDSARHTYRNPGVYTVTLGARGPRNDPVIVKLPAQID